MVPFWVPSIVRPQIFRVPKRDHNFDNHPYVIKTFIVLIHFLLGGLHCSRTFEFYFVFTGKSGLLQDLLPYMKPCPIVGSASGLWM